MIKLTVILATLLTSYGAFAADPGTCDPGTWRELTNEASVIGGHDAVVSRKDSTLVVHAGKKTFTFQDKNGEGAFDLHRVIAVSDNNLTLFEPRFDSANYRVIHLKSGKQEQLNGCPIWSPDGYYFASVNEDGGAGQNPNEAMLWFCAKPDQSCAKIWNLKLAGRSAVWDGKTVAISTVTAGVPEMVKVTNCMPDARAANCHGPAKSVMPRKVRK